MPGQDDMWEQDGVAPQCAVGNLDNNRVEIPKSPGFVKSFDESHYVKNYGWIFKIDNEKLQGYVKKRH